MFVDGVAAANKGSDRTHQVKLNDAAPQLPRLINAAIHREVALIATAYQQTIQPLPATHARHPRRVGSASGRIQPADAVEAPRGACGANKVCNGCWIPQQPSLRGHEGTRPPHRRRPHVLLPVAPSAAFPGSVPARARDPALRL